MADSHLQIRAGNLNDAGGPRVPSTKRYIAAPYNSAACDADSVRCCWFLHPFADFQCEISQGVRANRQLTAYPSIKVHCHDAHTWPRKFNKVGYCASKLGL